MDTNSFLGDLEIKKLSDAPSMYVSEVTPGVNLFIEGEVQAILSLLASWGVEAEIREDLERTVEVKLSEDDTWVLMTRLRDASIPFSGGRGYYAPSFTFSHFRDEGNLSGPFLEVSWRGPGDWYTREV